MGKNNTEKPARFSSSNDLGPDDIEVWLLAGDDVHEHHLAAFCQVLDTEELAKAGRFKFERDRRHYISAHALLRCLLSAHGGAKPKTWRFQTNAYGKPKIDAPWLERQLHFNLSHTSGLVGCAITWERDIGLDVERLERRVEVSDLAERFFAQDEATFLRTLEPGARFEAFFSFWTLKEAYIKAVGRGLSVPLDSFAFQLDPLAIVFADTSAGTSADWDFRLSRPSAQHVLALAVRSTRQSNLRYLYAELAPDQLASLCRNEE